MSPNQPLKSLTPLDQVTPVSKAAKNFLSLRLAAKNVPQYLSVHGRIYSVLLDYAQYKEMIQEFVFYRELRWQTEIIKRVIEAENYPEQLIPLKEAVGAGAYARILAIEPDEVPDAELFDMD